MGIGDAQDHDVNLATYLPLSLYFPFMCLFEFIFIKQKRMIHQIIGVAIFSSATLAYGIYLQVNTYVPTKGEFTWAVFRMTFRMLCETATLAYANYLMKTRKGTYADVVFNSAIIGIALTTFELFFVWIVNAVRVDELLTTFQVIWAIF